MQDPCEPTPHHAHVVFHHHPPAQVVGRIRRHGTHRIAQRLHAMSGGCPAGKPIVLGAATLKAVAPSMAFVALTAVASDVAAPAADMAGLGAPLIGEPGSVGAGSSHKHGHPHGVVVPEPPSLTLFLLALLGLAGLRIGRRLRALA